MEDRVIVYISEACPYCEQVKDLFLENGVKVKEKNVSLNERHYRQWKEQGYRGTPITLYQDKEVIGVQKNQLLEIIDLYHQAETNGYA